MNELQIRLTADIKDLQSALAKAKQTLKSFETETAADSEKSNVGFRRKIGLIEQLTAKAKQLKVSLAQATNEKQIAAYNAELEQTNIELARLNALGKSFAAPAVKSFNNLKSSVGAANGSAIAFNRIIQDAPFGLLGVGNNIQQFTEQLAFLKQTTGSTGAALKSFFTSLITPTNLLILGVSAVTSGLLAYQMSSKGAKDETEQLNDALGDFINSLKGVDKATLDSTVATEKEIFTFQSLVNILNDTNSTYRQRKNAVEQIQSGYGEYLGNLTDEEILVKGLGKAYENVISALIAKSALEANAKEINKNLQETAELNKKRNDEEQRYIQLQELLASKKGNLARTEELIASGEIKGTKRRNELRAEIQTILEAQKEYNVSIDAGTNAIQKNEALLKDLVNGYTGSLKSLLSFQEGQDDVAESGNKLNRVFDEQIFLVQRFGSLTVDARKNLEKLFDVKPKKEPFIEVPVQIDESKLEGLELPTTKEIQDPGIIEGLEKQIASFEKLKKVTSDPTMLALYTLQIDLLKNKLAEFNGEEVKSNLELIANAFGSMGQQIANSLGISNRSLRGFVTTLVSATPKIISAIMAQSAANSAKAAKDKVANLSQASGNVIVSATEAAKGLGPVGLALLPVFIAGALALVSSAFGKAGGGGSVSAGQGTTFGNRREFGGPVSKGRAYIVGEKRPELFVPNTNGIIVPQLPSMDYSGASMSAGAMAVDVNIRGVSYGDDILFTVQQAEIRRGLR
jgi:hypothetical protein